ncbi:MAG: UPF0280 family protein [Methanosphaera stadtmanae]|nr:UPF0280 family protein [Methanosphaera stadtmanae]
MDTQIIDIESTHILLKTDITKNNLHKLIIEQRNIIKDEIKRNPQFTLYEPIEIIKDDGILELMTIAGKISDTGPMSSVAGAISQICLTYLNNLGTKNSIIENGGDIALKTNSKIVIGLYAGKSPFSDNFGLKIKAKPHSYGICTSSGTVGHSKSFGRSDATIVFSKEASIADSLATSIGNYANGKNDSEIVHNAISKAEEFKEYYDGIIVIKGENFGKTGHIPKIVETDKKLSEYYDIE